MTTTHIAEALSRGGRTGTLQSPDLSLDIALGLPAEAVNTKPSITPELLFAGAYAACFHQALINTALNLGTPLAESTVRARVTVVEDAADSRRLAVELYAVLPGYNDAQARRLLDEAHTTCVYSKALRGDATVLLTAN